MKIKTILSENDSININKYLERSDIPDVPEYLSPTTKYLEPPMLFVNMQQAVELFKYHYEQQSKTFILCDSGDTDGITSASILYMYMKKLNPNWDIKFLIHTAKQRGMADEEVFDCIVTEKRPFVIIPDGGSNDKKQADILKDLVISLLILDHHICSTPIEHGVLINNQLGDTDRHGSGCFVTYQFMRQLDVEYKHNWAYDYIDMVALSLVADGCSFKSMQNREIMYQGFRNIKNEMLKGLIGDNEITPNFLIFNVIPCINSVCRSTDQQAKKDMIMGFIGLKDVQDILPICKKAHVNQKVLVSKIVEENIDSIDKNNNVIFFISEDVPRSYSGLIASKIMDKCENKPTIVGKIVNGYMMGSVRSNTPTLNLLRDSEFVDMAQGHECQHGIGIYEENIPKLIEYLNTLEFTDESAILVVQSYDIKSIPQSLFKCFIGYDELWGNDLPIPQVHIKSFILNSKDIQLIGKNKTTIKFTKDGLTFIKFYCNQEFKDKLFLNDNKNHRMQIEIIGELGINTYNGESSKQCVINHIEVIEKNINDIDDIF